MILKIQVFKLIVQDFSLFYGTLKKNRTVTFKESLERKGFNLQDHGKFSDGNNFSMFLETFEFLQFSRTTVSSLSHQLYDVKIFL